MTSKQRTARRLRCLGHVINLAAKAFLYGTNFDTFEKDADHAREHSEQLNELNLWRKRGPVGKLHNVVGFICRTPQRREKFAACKGFTNDEKESFNHLNLVVDNATRWNSLYSMVKRALDLKDRIDSFCVDHADALHGVLNDASASEHKDRLLSNDILKREDWQALSEVLAILEKFYDMTKRAEGSRVDGDRGVLSDYMTTLNELLNHVRLARDDLNIRADNPELSTDGIKHLRACIVNCWCKLDEYFAIVDSTPAVYAAVVTTPHMKWFYFEHAWKDATAWEDATEPENWLWSARNSLDSLWEEYKDLDLPVGELQDCGTKRARPPSPNYFDKATDMTLIQPEIQEDELETWIKARVFRLSRDETLPKYWLRQRQVRSTARLAQMGLDMAAIPAMSSECERVFSQAKLLIASQRHSLKPDTIEATQCLRMWFIMDRKKVMGEDWKKKREWFMPSWSTPILLGSGGGE
jgi:hypothetical protein